MLTSWLPVASEDDFSLDNLPFGIISHDDAQDTPHAAVAIGGYILDLKVLFSYYQSHNSPTFNNDLFPSLMLNGHEHIFEQPTLNAFASLGRPVHREVRKGLQTLLREDTPYPELLKDKSVLRKTALWGPNNEDVSAAVRMHLPMTIGDYTDFYAGYHHAFSVGCMLRNPANAIQPNYTHIPVGYHGRASTIRVSESSSNYEVQRPIHRPVGQILLDPMANPLIPTTEPSRKLDFELELGCFICKPNGDSGRIDIDRAEEHIFGYVLLNDWSARDIQAWEYIPLGPFNSKNFATSISPWVVLADALEPFRAKGIENPSPVPVQDYLREKRDDGLGFFDIKLEVDLICEFIYIYVLYSPITCTKVVPIIVGRYLG